MLTHNVYVYDGLGFEARHCPTLPNEIKKTKLQIYTSPQAGTNILLCAALSKSALESDHGKVVI